MKVVIAGIRYEDPVNKIVFDNYPLLVKAITDSGYKISEIISGAAIGVDTLGETYAGANNIPVNRKPANWNKYGKRAGPMRNKEMALLADAAVILWDGESKGTRNMIDNMIALNKPYFLMLTKTNTLESFFQ